MSNENLKIYEWPDLRSPRLLVGLSGWMDGGEVSTGTVGTLMGKLNAQKFAEISPEGFYIYNFPGMMETAALFRPHTRIDDGVIKTLEFPHNTFYAGEVNDLIFFVGREPNLAWEDYADCIFSLCERFGVEMVYFIGSVAGLVPHTREPRILCSVSDESLKPTFEKFGCKFADYEGPASLITYLTSRSVRHGVRMASLVAAVPAYVQGNNPTCIEAVSRRLAGMLGVHVDLDDLRAASDEFEKKLSEAIEQQPELAENIGKLEADYDNEIFDNEMGDLKRWLQQKGIRLD